MQIHCVRGEEALPLEPILHRIGVTKLHKSRQSVGGHKAFLMPAYTPSNSVHIGQLVQGGLVSAT